MQGRSCGLPTAAPTGPSCTSRPEMQGKERCGKGVAPNAALLQQRMNEGWFRLEKAAILLAGGGQEQRRKGTIAWRWGV